MKNGVPLAIGANNISYTSPPVSPEDNGAVFTLRVSNDLGSVVSTPATLTVTARAPQSGDLRFQQVDSATTVNGYTAVESTNLSSGGGVGSSGAIGTPLSIGLECCDWFMTFFAGPADSTTKYLAFSFDSLDQELQALSSPNTLVTGIDFQQPGTNSFGASWIQTGATGYVMEQHTVSPADLQSFAANEGANGRVITAISWYSGEVFYLSYEWQQDTGSAYEVQAVTATIDTVAVAAQQLADNGYIITATGGSVDDGFLLVGTRLRGDTMPRPLKIINTVTDGSPEPLAAQGYAIVGLIYNFHTSSSSATLLSNYWIGER